MSVWRRAHDERTTHERTKTHSCLIFMQSISRLRSVSKYMIYREPCLFSYLPSHCLCNLGLEFLHLHVRVHVHGEVIEFLQAANTMTHTHTRGYVQDSTCRYEDTSEELYNVSLYTAVSPSARSVDTHSHTHTHTHTHFHSAKHTRIVFLRSRMRVFFHRIHVHTSVSVLIDVLQ